MPEEFLFDVDISDEARFDAMVQELTSSVLGHVGCPPQTVADTVASVHAELARGVAEGLRRCHIQFRSRAGELEIVVCYEGGQEWRTTRSLS